jgi:hypothetical protein
MFLYIAGYQVCFGPITWCIVSETFPIEIRSKAIALCVELNYALNFAVQFVFPTLKDQLGWGRTFAAFSICLFFATFFIRWFVPETTGLTLEEIQTKLAAGSSPTQDDDDDQYRRWNQKIKKSSSSSLYATPASAPSTEETSLLLRHVNSSTFLGAHPSLEEMESQIIRTSSGGALNS